MLEKLFKLRENKTTVRTELLGGVTTFMTMAYILAVNPSILSAAGMDRSAVLEATALAAFVGTLIMALFANYPFALAPGLGLNAYFAYTVCGKMGYSWHFALLAVFVEGLIFILLSLTNIREAIFNAIPMTLKKGVSAGIGLFIAFIGFQTGKVVINDETNLVGIVNFHGDNFHTVGISAILTLLGLMIIFILSIKNVKGSILIGIFVTWFIGILCQLTGVYQIDPAHGFYSLIPSYDSFDIFAMGKTFGKAFDMRGQAFDIVNFLVVIFAFLFVDVFDTLGTVVGCANKAGMLDSQGRLPRIKQVLTADAVATSVGAVFGTSTTTTFVESSAGFAAGARTGLASVVTAVLFLISIVFAPIFTTIPSFATAPALIYIGFLMIESVIEIDFTDMTEAVPAYLCLIAMPLMYSISEGIAIGVISYVVINLLCGKAKKITILMYILCVLFILKYAIL